MEAGGRLKVRSAINPMLWLCAIITTPSLLAFALRPNSSRWLLVFAFAPEATAILGFLFLMLIDRDYLQSEEFQLRKMEIERIEEKGKPSIDSSFKTLPPPVNRRLLEGGRRMKYYILIYGRELGTRPQIKSCLDSLPEVISWRPEIPNSFFIKAVAVTNANALAMAIVNCIGAVNPRILVSEMVPDDNNSWGWLTRDSWEFLDRAPEPQ